MNKRILSVLLVVALLAAGCIFAAQATQWAPTDDEITAFNKVAETYPTMANVNDGFCPVCGENASIEWEALPTTGGTLTLGKHYYVADNIPALDTAYKTVDPGSAAGTDKTAASTVCIHLNGKEITASNKNYVLYVATRTTVNLMGSGTVVGAGEGASTGATIDSKGQLGLYGGTYKHAATTDNATLVQNRSNAYVRIYNGTLFTADQTETQTVYGSNIALLMGYIEMYGGIIENGNHSLNINGTTDGHDSIQTFGGNVFVRNNNDVAVSVFNMYDGTIRNGKAGKGGNVAIATVGANQTVVTFNMFGGEIIDGTAVRATAASGGNVYLDSRTGVCKFIMSGGTVSGGKTTTDGTTLSGNGGNFYLAGSADCRTEVRVNEDKGESLIKDGQSINGGNVYVGKYSYFSLNGDVSGGLAGGSDEAVNYGGNVYVCAGDAEKTEFYHNGGTISGGKADKGGNVAINAAKAEVVIAGTVKDGNHNTRALGTDTTTGAPLQMGGNLYVAKCAVTIVKNGKLLDGKSRNGGNIGIEGTGKVSLQLQNATISGGTARYTGGNIYMMGDSTTVELGRMDKANASDTEKTLITGGTITSGDATANKAGVGGNIHILGGTLNLKKGTVTNGISSREGCNLYVAGGTVNISGADITDSQAYTATQDAFAGNIHMIGGTINHTAGTVSGGKGINGGNVSVLGESAKYTLNGGTVEGGYASARGNNFYLRAGVVELLGGAINNNTTEVETSDFDGNSLYCGVLAANKVSKVVIGGNMTINSGDYKSDIYLHTQSTGLVINGDFTGEVNITIPGAASDPKLRPTSGFYGYAIGSEYVKEGATAEFGATGAYTGKVTMMANATTAVPLYPVANGNTEGLTHNLVVASVRGTTFVGEGDEQEKVQTWYPSAEAAIDGGDDYFALFADDTIEIAEGKTAFVNINGKNVTVSGKGDLVFYDAVAEKGKVTVTGDVTLVNNHVSGKLTETNSGATYLTVKNGDETFSSYSLRNKLKGVSLRPSTSGIYFRGTWAIDEQIANNVKNYGVIVSRVAQPDANFANNDKMWYTAYTVEDWDGEEKTGVEVTNIFKAGENNAVRGKDPIYAAAYVVVNNGVEDVTIVDAGDGAFSMYRVLDMMEDSEAVWGTYADALNAFYNTWAADLADWAFDRLGK